MTRPPRAPDLLAALEAAVSARVAKRVKEAPALAEAWTWTVTDTAVEVRADDVVVRVVGSPVQAGGLSCTCLMAPKCVHVLAVATVLPEAAAAPEASAAPLPEAAAAPPADPPGGAPGGAVVPTGATPNAIALTTDPPAAAPSAPEATPTHAPVALRAHASLGALLRLGAHAADVVVRADLSRAAYEARAVGLHRLARALDRVVRSLRLLEAGHPTFALATLVEEVTEALDVARGLAHADAPELVGEARRTYMSVGTLRLYGVCSEPVLVGTGHAGVVTWFVDGRGRRWHVSDVRPRAAGQAAGVYDVAPTLTTLSHRKLGREGLFVQGATAAGGRLGAGAGVSAVRAAGADWGAFAPAPAPGPSRPPGAPASAPRAADGDDLRLVTGIVRGLWRDALVLAVDDGDVLVLPGSEHASLPWRDNLRLLARAPGLRVRILGRDVPARPRAIVGLAAAPLTEPPVAGTPPADTPPARALHEPALPRLHLPPDWAGRVNLGLDRLTTAHLPGCAPEPARLAGDAPDRGDLLAPLRRRVSRALLGGAASLPADAATELHRDTLRLRAGLASGAADLLDALAAAARAEPAPGLRAKPSMTSSAPTTPPPIDPPALPRAWLAAALYLAAADRERARRAWG